MSRVMRKTVSCIMLANNKSARQYWHPRDLINTFAFRCIDNMSRVMRKPAFCLICENKRRRLAAQLPYGYENVRTVHHGNISVQKLPQICT